MSLKIEAFPRIYLLLLQWIMWREKSFTENWIEKKVDRMKKCNVRLCCATKSATIISSKNMQFEAALCLWTQNPKTSLKNAKILLEYLEIKRCHCFSPEHQAALARLFGTKINEMHEFSFASTFSVLHVSRCICFLFSVCIMWISLVLSLLLLFFFSFSLSSVLSFSLADNFAVNAMFIRCSILTVRRYDCLTLDEMNSVHVCFFSLLSASKV